MTPDLASQPDNQTELVIFLRADFDAFLLPLAALAAPHMDANPSASSFVEGVVALVDGLRAKLAAADVLITKQQTELVRLSTESREAMARAAERFWKISGSLQDELTLLRRQRDHIAEKVAEACAILVASPSEDIVSAAKRVMEFRPKLPSEEELQALRDRLEQIRPVSVSTLVGMHETSGSIATWARETFGESPSNISSFRRARKEWYELENKLIDDDNDPAAVDEIADVVICLSRILDRHGVDLSTAVDRKMKINRARKWVVKDGHGQHVEGEPTITVKVRRGPPSSDAVTIVADEIDCASPFELDAFAHRLEIDGRQDGETDEDLRIRCHLRVFEINVQLMIQKALEAPTTFANAARASEQAVDWFYSRLPEATVACSEVTDAEWTCPVDSQECAIRKTCTNKCGRLDEPRAADVTLPEIVTGAVVERTALAECLRFDDRARDDLGLPPDAALDYSFGDLSGPDALGRYTIEVTVRPVETLEQRYPWTAPHLAIIRDNDQLDQTRMNAASWLIARGMGDHPALKDDLRAVLRCDFSQYAPDPTEKP